MEGRKRRKGEVDGRKKKRSKKGKGAEERRKG